jgi:hypothetical protein
MAVQRIKFAIVAAIGLLCAQYSYADLGDGLVAYYPFDGNADDASGNGYDLTLVGSPSLSGTGPFGGSAALAILRSRYGPISLLPVASKL